MEVTQEKFLELIRQAAGKDTSSDPDNWSTDNPLWGHCAVVSLVAQDYFGGELVRGSLQDVPEFAHLRSHYWNKLPDGKEVDFTAEQFKTLLPALEKEVRPREQMLGYPDTQRRYELLKDRLGALS